MAAFWSSHASLFPTEMIYRHTAVIDGEMVHFEILDTAGQEDSLQIEEKIKWGDGFAVVYSVTDRCSFDEVMRLCFLINHIHSSPKRSGGSDQPPVVIVGNKKDLQFDRMVSCEDGENLSKALKLPFYEISTRDSYEETVVARTEVQTCVSAQAMVTKVCCSAKLRCIGRIGRKLAQHMLSFCLAIDLSIP
uniref:small monomeric GTPase n=1 Tax=Gopherus evgoodei TaxID=1825980 RepID=A0A8C4WLR6_9SAUR